MRFTTLALAVLVSTAACSKKDPLAELDKLTDKVCAATDYKTGRAAWTAALAFIDDNDDGDNQAIKDIARQIVPAIIDHNAVKTTTGRANKLLTCAEKTGAF